MVEIKKYLNNKKIIKGSFKSYVFSAGKKITAFSCVAGLMMITNLPLVSAYEAHTVNVTARIVNNIPGINPPSGEFCNDGRLEVELSVSLEGADIYYTIDGTNPACGLSAKYNLPFEIPNGIITVKAVACHEELRNGELIVVQSAAMTEEFDTSVLSIIVSEPENGDVWYCDPSNPYTYFIEWTVENYRDANELSIDIIYITDNDNNGIISAGDNNFSIANNLMGATGSYSFVLSENYCYYGYGWAKVIVTEASVNPDTNNCKNFGISGRIFDPMVLNNSSDGSVSDGASVAPEIEATLEEPEISDNNNLPSDLEDTSNDDSDSSFNNNDSNSEDSDDEDLSEEIKDEDSEDDADENIEADDDMDNDNLDEDSEDDEENTDDIDNSNNDDLDGDNIGNEEDTQEDEGIIMGRDDDEEMENNDEENDDNNEDNNEESSEDIIEDDTNNNDTNEGDEDNENNTDSKEEGDDDSSDDDDVLADGLLIEGDDDSTEIEFSL